MKAVLISIKPKWVEKIASGEKTIEVRKTRPKLEVPFKCYIYATWNGSKKEILVKQDGLLYCEDWRKANGLQRASGKVIGEFVCDNVIQWNYKRFITMTGTNDTYFPFRDDLKATCLSYEEFANYGKGKTLYGWHISDLKIYDEPKELSEFRLPCTQKQCASWCKDMKVEKAICLNKGKRFITRPPQSWQFVEKGE